MWSKPLTLERPTLVIAFSGWNDAGDAASSAVRFLIDTWDAQEVGHIDAENFYDFSQTRPIVEIDTAGDRQVQWPNPIISATDGTTVPPAVFLLGAEPQLRWRSFAEAVVQIAADINADRIIHLGALLAEVPHSRPVPVTASGRNGDPIPDRAERYQGPTGIIGVLHQMFHDAGANPTSIWAAVPTYLSGASSPKAALALVERLATMLDVAISAGLLEISAQAYEHEIAELVAGDDDTAAYIQRLEHDFDHDKRMEAASALPDEVEQYLKDHFTES